MVIRNPGRTIAAKPEAPAASPAKKRGCRGCLSLIGKLLLVVLVLGGIAAVFLFRVPQRIGLVPSAAERHLQATPDRAGAEALLAEARTAGMNTQGVSLYVLPYNDQGSVAVAVLDAREGFAFARGGSLNGVTDVFVKIAGGGEARTLGVEYLTVQYISQAGRTIMTLTAPRSSVAALAVGALSEDEFRAQLQGDVDFPAFMAEQMDSLQDMLQES